MDFLDPKKKRSHRRRLYIGYVLMTIALVLGMWFLWNISSGNYYDPKTKTVIQNGMLFLDSHPESAQIVINGQDKGRTDNRLLLPAGPYNVELKRDGYRTWKHDVSLEGGAIERFIYPFMFPEKLESSDSQLFSTQPSLATQSPDRRWLIVQQPETFNNFSVTDLNSKNIEFKPIVLPPTVLTQTGTKHVVSALEWSTDNRHVLLKHVFDTGYEFIILDRESAAASVNLNQQFGRVISDVKLRDKKYDRYYFHNSASGDLVSGVLESKSVTQVAGKVISYQPHGSNLLMYVTNEKAPAGKVLVKIMDGDKTYTLHQLDQSPKYLLDLAQFDGKWYVAAGASVEQKVSIYIDPFDELKKENASQLPASVLLRLNAPVQYMAFSANTRLLEIQSGSSFAVYDAENKRQFRYDTKLNLPLEYQATWMDGHRLTAISDGKLRVFDFDGTNMQTLMNSTPAFTPFFDRDYRKLYTVSPSATVKNKTALLFTDLIVAPK